VLRAPEVARGVLLLNLSQKVVRRFGQLVLRVALERARRGQPGRRFRHQQAHFFRRHASHEISELLAGGCRTPSPTRALPLHGRGLPGGLLGAAPILAFRGMVG